MGKQLHKRLSKEFVEEVLEAFNSGRITETKACELIGIKRTQRWQRESFRENFSVIV